MNDMNPQFDCIGKSFVELFYKKFDSLLFRVNATEKDFLRALYHDHAFMTFEGHQVQGIDDIMDKFMKLPFESLVRVLTTVDCHPIADFGVVVMVVGQLKVILLAVWLITITNGRFMEPMIWTDNDPPKAFSHTFILRPECREKGNYRIFHDIFRLCIHNM